MINDFFTVFEYVVYYDLLIILIFCLQLLTTRDRYDLMKYLNIGMGPNLYSTAWQQPHKRSSIYFRLGTLPFVGWSTFFHRSDQTQTLYFGQNGREDKTFSRYTDWNTTCNSSLAILFLLDVELLMLIFNDMNLSLAVFKILVKLWMIVLLLLLIRLGSMIYRIWQTRQGYYPERPQWQEYEWWRFAFFLVGLCGLGYQSMLIIKLVTVLFSLKWAYLPLSVACQFVCSLFIAVSLEIVGRLFYKTEEISGSRSLR